MIALFAVLGSDRLPLVMRLSLFFLVLLGAAQMSVARVIHVAPQARGYADGNSWGDACDLHMALDRLAEDGDELWLEGGTYLPTGMVAPSPTEADAAIAFRVRHSRHDHVGQ